MQMVDKAEAVLKLTDEWHMAHNNAYDTYNTYNTYNTTIIIHMAHNKMSLLNY